MKYILLIIFFLVSFCVGQNTYSAYFDSTIYATMMNGLGFGQNDTWTLEGWLKIPMSQYNQSNKAYYIFSDEAANNVAAIRLPGYNYDGIEFRREWGGIPSPATIPGDSAYADAGIWIHFALVYNGAGTDTFLIYQGNANVLDTLANSVAGASASTTFDMRMIGARWSDSLYFGKFYIDELRIWNVRRTLPEIRANYKIELNGNESGLIKYFKYEQNLNNSVTDSSDYWTANKTMQYSMDVPFTSASSDSTYNHKGITKIKNATKLQSF